MTAKQKQLNPEEWLDTYGDVLFRYAMSRLSNRAEAEDVMQETFLAAMKARKSFNGKSSEQTWLIGILKHKIIDHIRKVSRERASDDIELIQQLNSEDSQYFDRKGHWKVAPNDWQIDPVKSMEQTEFWDVFHQCMGTLHDRMHKAFTLRELEGLSAEEICKTMDITETNLWVILYRARAQLRTCLENNWIMSKGSDA